MPVYERLGDVRASAVAKGKIAGILQVRGELDQARVLQEEGLASMRALRDADGIASGLWAIAQLDLAQENIADALPRIAEAYAIVQRLGRAEGIAAIGDLHGQMLVANGQGEEGLGVRRTSAAAMRRLGRADKAAEVEALIQQIEGSIGR